jgi:hypothetical protein
MGGGTRTKTTQEPQVPDYMAPLMRQTATRGAEFQDAAPLQPFLEAKPMKVAGLSAREQEGLSLIPQLNVLGKRRVTGENLSTSPSLAAARQAYETSVLPGVENTAAVSGLGRSTALTNARAASEAAYLAPTIEAELAREERGNQNEQAMTLAQLQALLSGGGLERGVEQAGYEAEQSDLLRRQALAETGLFGPAGAQLLPSAIGQQSTTRGKQGIFTGG